jgi:hypothetical protein
MKMHKLLSVRWVVAVYLGLLAAAAAQCRADTLSLTPSRDTSIFSENDNSEGKGTSLYVGRTNGNPLRRGLVDFDLSTVPAGATVTGVTLKLHLNKTGPGPGGTITLHRLLDDWGEGTSGTGSGSGGRGGAPTANSSTWNFTFYQTTRWTTAGGDFDSAASAGKAADAPGFYTFSDPQLTTDVQSWLADPTKNFGWILIGNESTRGSAVRFDSREASAANRPSLAITFSVPEPASVVSLAGLSLCLRRRRDIRP